MAKKLRHILGFAAVLGLGVWVAVAIAATRVTVYSPDGDRKQVNVADADEDVTDETYMVKSREVQVTGPSLRSLLRRAGVGYGSWRSVEIGSATMTQREYEKYGSQTPPAFNVDDGGTFVIPNRGNQPGREIGGRLTVEAFAVERGVVVNPGSPTVKAGASVTFTPEPFGDISGTLRYVWTLEGQDRKTSRQATYRFPKRGTYDVDVTVTGQDSRATGGAVVTVDPKKSDETGDDDEDEGDDDSATGGPTDSGGVGSPYTPPATDSDYPTPDSDFPTTPDTPAPTAPTAPDLEPGAPGFSGVSVAGDLMSATAPAPGAGDDEEPFELPAVGAGTPQFEDPEFTVSGAALLVGSVLGLVGIGAGREFERLDPRRWLKRRRWMKRPKLSALRRLLPR
jgi:hypothetical protein